jgi:hypothetical protein
VKGGDALSALGARPAAGEHGLASSRSTRPAAMISTKRGRSRSGLPATMAVAAHESEEGGQRARGRNSGACSSRSLGEQSGRKRLPTMAVAAPLQRPYTPVASLFSRPVSSTIPSPSSVHVLHRGAAPSDEDNDSSLGQFVNDEKNVSV